MADEWSRYPLNEKSPHKPGSAVRLHKADDGDIVWPEPTTAPLGVVIAAVAEQCKVSADDLRFHGRRVGILKAVAIDLCCRFSGGTQREVAKAFGYRDASSVGKQRRTLALHLARNPTLANNVASIEKALRRLNS